ncbi:SGNH/GDSL hydrolase family protein [Candidatus Actinomarina sp.]|nr:SGNH/GDSL hydrolase family protein [Candidatus Actinomarina sp.]
MAVVNLLGDSIIDNKVYVGPHELSVTEHLHNLTDDVINSIAVDGHTTKDVIRAQLDKLPYYSTHQVLSIGGNDLLQNMFFLKNTENLTANEVFEQSVGIMAPIKRRYQTIVEKLSLQNSNILLCTVYEGNLLNDPLLYDIALSSKAMVSMLNDIVYSTANTYNAQVLELRNIFTKPKDYANPIEPSHIGGSKFALEINDWIQQSA